MWKEKHCAGVVMSEAAIIYNGKREWHVAMSVSIYLLFKLQAGPAKKLTFGRPAIALEGIRIGTSSAYLLNQSITADLPMSVKIVWDTLPQMRMIHIAPCSL